MEIKFLLKFIVCKDKIFVSLSPAVKQLLEKLYIEFSIFLALEIKKLAIVGKILRRFDIVLYIFTF